MPEIIYPASMNETYRLNIIASMMNCAICRNSVNNESSSILIAKMDTTKNAIAMARASEYWKSPNGVLLDKIKYNMITKTHTKKSPYNPSEYVFAVWGKLVSNSTGSVGMDIFNAGTFENAVRFNGYGVRAIFMCLH